jgi:DNA topoisomerase-1
MRLKLPPASATPEKLANVARLRYVSDDGVGYIRQRRGNRFIYLSTAGARVRDPDVVARIESLAIPPAWQEVWICRFASGHLQATGRDSRKRKQYVYHPRWQEIANLAKFSRLRAFGDVLPRLRRAISRDLAGRKLTRERVLAGVVGLLDVTSIRIGNEEYVSQNGSYGLTTLRDRHVSISGRCVDLRFVGKSGLRKQVCVDDGNLVRLIKQARDVPGPRLFQYLSDEGKRHVVTAADANDYFREITGEPFTAKDFRTWKASAVSALLFYEQCELVRPADRRRVLKAVVDEAAASLGNTPTICRNYYIHPGLLEAYADGSFAEYLPRFAPRRRKYFKLDEQILDRFLAGWESARMTRLSA